MFGKNMFWGASKIAMTLAVMSGAGVSSSVLAQDNIAADDQDGLNVIVVVAERRSENLQDVPLAVTALGGDLIQEGAITDLEDVAIRIPNTKLSTFNIGEPQIYIRGIGNTSDSIGSDPAVGLFLDDVYISRTGAASFNLFDLERVEVLRGPQGTLYGKNVIGGAISVVTKKPSFDFEAKVGLTYGNLDKFAVQGYVSGPLSDKVAGKFVISKSARDGYAFNPVTGQDLDDENNLSMRGQLLFQPEENLEILIGGDYSKDDTNGRCRTLTNLEPALQSGLGATFASTELAAIQSTGADDIRTCTQSLVQDANKELFGFLGKITYDFDWAQLTSITAYRESEFDWIQNLGGVDSPPSLIAVIDSAAESSSQLSQEVRLAGTAFDDRLDWVTGMFFLKEKARRSETFVDIFNFAAFKPFEGSVTFFQSSVVKSWAAFADLKFDLTDQLTLGVGGRFSKDKKTLQQSAVDNVNDGSPPAIPLGPGAPYSAIGSNSWEQFTPRASIDWRPVDGVLAYLSWAKGFKSGAFPSQATSAAVAVSTLEPEEATNIELGLKTEFWDRRIRINAAAFDLDYTNLQVFSLINLQLVTANARKASVRGLEFDFAAKVIPNFTLTGSLAFLDTKYDDFVVTNPNTGTTNNNTGNRLARAPKNTWSISGLYEIPLGGTAGQINLSATLSHSGNFFHEASNDPRSLIHSYELLDASIAYLTDDERFEIRGWVKNLTDAKYPIHSINSTFGGATQIFAAPRTYGVSASVKF